MKKFLILLLCAALFSLCAIAEEPINEIIISDESITVNGAPITDETVPVYLQHITETHKDVPEELSDVENRVITITSAGTYSFTGKATDLQIAVMAPETDKVTLILSGVDITCRTAPCIAVYSGLDPRTPGEYGVAIVLNESTDNLINGSHTSAEGDEPEFDGPIGSQISLGIEGTGSLTVVSDKEGIEVASGHLTINGGNISITSADDPVNTSEDGVGVITVNGGYLYSAVSPELGEEGDGMDSNGYIEINGGTVINLAHPSSGDSGIDSDLGSSINGGIVVGAGNMYDEISASSEQLFMLLEFANPTSGLIVLTDETDSPVFAFEFPHEYMYIAFSTPELVEGNYTVYTGGEIEGISENGLYTEIASYAPGTLMQHGGGTASQNPAIGEMPQMPDMNAVPGGEGMTPPEFAGMNPFGDIDLNEILAGTDLNELLSGKDLNSLLTGFSITDILTEDQITEYFGNVDPAMLNDFGRFGGFGGKGGPRGLESSSETSTTTFSLSHETTGFTNISPAK